MKWWRTLIPGLLLLAGLMALLALRLQPSPPAEPEEPLYLIGLSQANLVEPWRVAMNLEFEKAAAEHPELRVIYTDAAQDTQRQIADVEMLMGYGVDLLVISPNEGEALAPVIARAHERVPVIVLDREIEGEDFTLFLGVDNEQAGYLAGELLAGLIRGGSVVELDGAQDSPPMVDRAAGFERALREHPDIRVTQRLQANWLQDQAQDRMKEEILISSRVPDAVVAQSDDMAYGARIALDDLQLAGRVRIVGMGGENSDALVREGILDGGIRCPTGGREAVEWVLRILSGEVPEQKRILLAPERIPG